MKFSKKIFLLNIKILATTIIYIFGWWHEDKPMTRADVWWAKPGQKFQTSLGSCSVGFPAWTRTTPYFITAGHCFRAENGAHYTRNDGGGMDVYDPSNNLAVGYEYLYATGWGYNNMYVDISLVRMYPGRYFSDRGWNGIPTRPLNSFVGDQACIAGERLYKTRCGTVLATNVVSGLYGYEGMNYIVDQASYCSWHGDSGGAVYNRYGALGINSSGDWRNENDATCYSGTVSEGYVPIIYALNWLRTYIPNLTIY